MLSHFKSTYLFGLNLRIIIFNEHFVGLTLTNVNENTKPSFYLANI